jgi:hypothetical protein
MVNCQKDDEHTFANDQQKSTAIQFKIKTLPELEDDLKFRTAIQKVTSSKKINSLNVLSRTVMEDQYGFSIDYTTIKEVNINNFTSYTMLIRRDSTNVNFYENLVVQVNELDETLAYVVKYIPSSSESDNQSNENSLFKGETKITPITYNANESPYGKIVWGCNYLYEVLCNGIAEGICGGSYHEVRSECNEFTSSCISLVQVDRSCGYYDDGTGEGGGENNTNGSTSGAPTGNTSNPLDEEYESGYDPTDPSIHGGVITSAIPDEDVEDLMNTFINTLSLAQQIWWNDTATDTQQSQIESYINANGDFEFAQQAIEALRNDGEVDFEEMDYPGMDIGYSYQWWLDEEFVETNFSFELDDQNFGDLTAEEKLLVAFFPAQALIIKANKNPAEQETFNRFGINGRNDKSDAFRHAFFNAMNANDVGIQLALAFSNAHESETPSLLIKEVQMDIHNNAIGVNIGVNASIFVSDLDLSNTVYQSLLNGLLYYLNPLDWISSPPYDANGDDIQDCSNCLNGIIPSTTLTPTNLP